MRSALRSVRLSAHAEVSASLSRVCLFLVSPNEKPTINHASPNSHAVASDQERQEMAQFTHIYAMKSECRSQEGVTLRF